MKAVSLSLAAALALIAFAGPACAADKTIAGRAIVTDGDTLRINNRRIRIHGIDAPEKRQTCKRPDGTPTGLAARSPRTGCDGSSAGDKRTAPG